MEIIKNKKTWFIILTILISFIVGFYVNEILFGEKEATGTKFTTMICKGNEKDENSAYETRYTLYPDDIKIIVDFVIDSPKYTNFIVQFNNVKVDEQDFGCSGEPEYVGTLDDLIIIGYNTSCGIRGSKIIAYTITGEKVKTWEYLDTEHKGMEVNSDQSTVIGSSIIVGADAMDEGEDLALSDPTVDPQLYFPLYDCTKAKLTAAGLDENYPLTATYQIDYLGDSKFADPVIIDSYTIAQSEYCK